MDPRLEAYREKVRSKKNRRDQYKLNQEAAGKCEIDEALQRSKAELEIFKQKQEQAQKDEDRELLRKQQELRAEYEERSAVLISEFDMKKLDRNDILHFRENDFASIYAETKKKVDAANAQKYKDMEAQWKMEDDKDLQKLHLIVTDQPIPPSPPLPPTSSERQNSADLLGLSVSGVEQSCQPPVANPNRLETQQTTIDDNDGDSDDESLVRRRRSPSQVQNTMNNAVDHSACDVDKSPKTDEMLENERDQVRSINGERTIQISEVDEQDYITEVPKGSGKYYIMRCPDCPDIRFANGPSSCYFHFNNKWLKHGFSVTRDEAHKRCGIRVEKATHRWANYHNRPLEASLKLSRSARKAKSDKSSSRLNTRSGRSASLKSDLKNLDGKENFPLSTAEDSDNEQRNSTVRSFDAAELDDAGSRTTPSKKSQWNTQDESTKRSRGTYLQEPVDSSTTVATHDSPDWLRGVPIEKLDEDSSYWDRGWNTWNDWLNTMKVDVAATSLEKHRSHPELCRLSIGDLEYNLQKEQANLEKRQEVKNFFDNYYQHPNQLLSKIYIGDTGLLAGQAPYSLYSILTRLETARKTNSIDAEPFDWVRQRMGEMIQKNIGLFRPKECLQISNNDGKFEKICQTLAQLSPDVTKESQAVHEDADTIVTDFWTSRQHAGPTTTEKRKKHGRPEELASEQNGDFKSPHKTQKLSQNTTNRHVSSSESPSTRHSRFGSERRTSNIDPPHCSPSHQPKMRSTTKEPTYSTEFELTRLKVRNSVRSTKGKRSYKLNNKTRSFEPFLNGDNLAELDRELVVKHSDIISLEYESGIIQGDTVSVTKRSPPPAPSNSFRISLSFATADEADRFMDYLWVDDNEM